MFYEKQKNVKTFFHLCLFRWLGTIVISSAKNIISCDVFLFRGFFLTMYAIHLFCILSQSILLGRCCGLCCCSVLILPLLMNVKIVCMPGFFYYFRWVFTQWSALSHSVASITLWSNVMNATSKYKSSIFISSRKWDNIKKYLKIQYPLVKKWEVRVKLTPSTPMTVPIP